MKRKSGCRETVTDWGRAVHLPTPPPPPPPPFFSFCRAIIREHARSYLVKALEHDSSNILAKLRLAEVQFGRWTPITVEGSGEAVHGTVLGTGMLIETT